MVAALRERGVEAAIVSTDDDGPGRLDLPLGRWFEHGGVPVLLFPRWSPPLAPLREFAYAPGLGSWLRRQLPDWDLLHVHALFSWPSTWGMAIARRRGCPYVLRPIGQLQCWSLRRSAWRKQLFLRAIENANIGAAALVQVTSTLEADDLRQLALTDRIRVLPLGVEPRPLASSDPEPGHLLFLSRLHPKKGLEVLLQGLALLRRRQPALAWQLTVAGSGEPAYVARLQALCTQLGLQDHCRWVGFVSGAAKLSLLQSSAWFVLPSATENFAIAAAEALAAGTPVILSPEVGIAAEVAAAGAGLVCRSEPQAIAGTLADALQTSAAPFRAAARQLASQRYAWPAIAAELEQIYASLLTPVAPRRD